MCEPQFPSTVITPSIEELMGSRPGFEGLIDEILDHQKISFTTWMDDIVAHMKDCYSTSIGLDGMLENSSEKLKEVTKELEIKNCKITELTNRYQNLWDLYRDSRQLSKEYEDTISEIFKNNEALRKQLKEVTERPRLFISPQPSPEDPPPLSLDASVITQGMGLSSPKYRPISMDDHVAHVNSIQPLRRSKRLRDAASDAPESE